MNAVATVTETRSLAEAYSVDEVLRQVKLVQQVMTEVMKKDEHYGTIPGCGNKQTLLKAGAEKLLFCFRLVPTFTVEERQYAGDHREYRTTARVSTRDGIVVGEGVGTCSTMESKYRYRNGSVKCPQCGKEAVIKGKSEYGGGWICFTKKGGCGEKWNDGDKAIEGQQIGKVENPDPADQYNTVLKMSKKRALVDAAITATAASDIFTQDLDELETAAPGMHAAPIVQPEPKHAGKAQAVGVAAQTMAPIANSPEPVSTTGKTSAAIEPTPAKGSPLSDAGNIGKGATEEQYRLLIDAAGRDFAVAVWHSSAEKTWPSRHALIKQALDAITSIDERVGQKAANTIIGAILKRHGYNADDWKAERPKPTEFMEGAIRTIVSALVYCVESGESPVAASHDDSEEAPF